MKILGGGRVPVKIWTDEVEAEAQAQLERLAQLPFLHQHVAVMPDVHAGRGSTVGTVIATKGAIIPSAVGVDIGCGMAALRLPFSINDVRQISQLRTSFERAIPVGRHAHKKLSAEAAKQMARLGIPVSVRKGALVLRESVPLQLGTLGGGNHFLELCHDESDSAWMVLHSGSRNVGKTLADLHIGKAKGLLKEALVALPDPELAYLAQGTPEFKDYIADLFWAQRYAAANRAEIMRRALRALCHHHYSDTRWKDESWDKDLISCHHNYSQRETHFGEEVWITRKGAVSAKAGELGIIPGSMGTKSYIVRGLGNAQSFHSCAHGAGRRMSRTKARARFTLKDLRAQTEGVECRKTDDLLDEIPGAYKDIDEVMANQADLVEVVHTLKQVLCVKG